MASALACRYLAGLTPAYLVFTLPRHPARPATRPFSPHQSRLSPIVLSYRASVKQHRTFSVADPVIWSGLVGPVPLSPCPRLTIKDSYLSLAGLQSGAALSR